MPEQTLDHADISIVFQKVGRKQVAQGVHGHALALKVRKQAVRESAPMARSGSRGGTFGLHTGDNEACSTA